MTPTRTAEPTANDLDEGVLNAGTTLRFVLLLVLCVAEGTGTARNFVSRLTAASGGDGEAIPAWVSYLLPAVLIAAAIWLYRKLPTWKGRGSRVVPVERVGDGGVLRRELDSLVVQAGLDTQPRFVLDPGAKTASAVVFGTGRRATVRLNAGLIVTSMTYPLRFRAIVLHELAHIRNHDVGITYATVAMWRVLLGAVLLPDAVLIVGAWLAGTSVVEVNALVQKVLVVLMVYLTRADILRRRELYADRTAVRTGKVANEALLPRIWDGHHGGNRWSRAVAAFVEAWRPHPSWQLRSRSLDAPDELFTMRRLPMVVTGMAAATASAQLTSPIGSAGSWLGMLQYGLISGLVIGVGGVALWRVVVHAVLTGRPIPSGWVAGLWLGIGLSAGELVNGGSDGEWRLPTHPEVLVIVIAVTALLMAWTAQFAELRIRTYRGESLNVAMVAGLIAPWLVLGFVLLWWNTGVWNTGSPFSVGTTLAHADLPTTGAPSLLRLTAVLTALPGSDLGLNGLWWTVPLLWLIPLELWLSRLPMAAPNWLVRSKSAVQRRFSLMSRSLPNWIRTVGLLATALVWLIVLLASVVVLFSVGLVGYLVLSVLARLIVVRVLRIRREQRGARPTTYWLDQARPGSAPPVMNAPELRWVVRIGVLGGVACWLGLLAQPLVTSSARTFQSWRVDSLVALTWIVVVVTAVMAVVAALSARGRYPLITALIAAGVTAVVALVGQYLRSTVDGCLGPLNTIATTCSWQPIRYLPLVEYALGFVLGPGLLVAGLVAALAGALSRQRRPPADNTSTASPQLARPRVAVGFVNALAICLVGSVTGHQTFTMAAPIQQSNLLFAYETSPSGYTRTGISTLTEWMSYVSRTLRRHGDVFVIMAEAGKALGRDDTVTEYVATIRTIVPPACAILSDIADNAEAEAKLYDPDAAEEGERLWLRYLATVRTAAADCLALMRAETEPAIVARLKAFTADSNDAYVAGKAFADWLSETY